MTFSHPLARHAKVWPRTGSDGAQANTLVVITTLSLDPEDKAFKQNKVETLTKAVKDYLKANPKEARGFVLMNRPKDWAGDKEA